MKSSRKHKTRKQRKYRKIQKGGVVPHIYLAIFDLPTVHTNQFINDIKIRIEQRYAIPANTIQSVQQIPLYNGIEIQSVPGIFSLGPWGYAKLTPQQQNSYVVLQIPYEPQFSYLQNNALDVDTRLTMLEQSLEKSLKGILQLFPHTPWGLTDDGISMYMPGMIRDPSYNPSAQVVSSPLATKQGCVMQ